MTTNPMQGIKGKQFNKDGTRRDSPNEGADFMDRVWAVGRKPSKVAKRNHRAGKVKPIVTQPLRALLTVSEFKELQPVDPTAVRLKRNRRRRAASRPLPSPVRTHSIGEKSTRAIRKGHGLEEASRIMGVTDRLLDRSEMIGFARTATAKQIGKFRRSEKRHYRLMAAFERADRSLR